MTEPISPGEAKKLKAHLIPTFMYQAVNELLVARYDDHAACVIKETELLERAYNRWKQQETNVPETFETFKRMVYDRHWLDFEDAYKQQGWNVIYDRPGYDETYGAFYKFSRKY